MKTLVGIDSQIATYLIQAMSGQYDPSTDTNLLLARERVAAFRIFLYHRVLYVTPTVKKEVQAIHDLGFRDLHIRLGDILLDEVRDLDENSVNAQAQVYYRYHSKGKNAQNDCCIVAEAEHGGLDVLLTFDLNLSEHLDGYTKSLRLMSPSQYWTKLGIPRGTPSYWAPESTNPLSSVHWWRWD